MACEMRKSGMRVTRGNAYGNASSRLIPANEWHPLDGVPAPEYVPQDWDGPHVGLRMMEAFKTLARLPNSGVGQKSSAWPEYRHEWEDLLAQQGADADVREDAARAQNRARLMPTAEDVSRMEKVIGWPARYLHEKPRIARLVQRAAYFRARDLSLDIIARRLRRSPAMLRRDNQVALDSIASGLRCDGEPVF
jgi:hypothetical protein